jgi:molybdenum cofactor sulfurtransferase
MTEYMIILYIFQGGLRLVSVHTFSLVQFVYTKLREMHHENGAPVVDVYCDSDFKDRQQQGPIIAFNIRQQDGSYVGYSQVGRSFALCHKKLKIKTNF